MSKADFSKVEKSFDEAVHKLSVENLNELAAIANAIHDPQSIALDKNVEKIVEKFQKELQRFKKDNPDLYNKLLLTAIEEERLSLPIQEFTREDWVRIQDLKKRIVELKSELQGNAAAKPAKTNNAEDTQQVAQERKRHVNKRFNVRDGWLPLK